MTNYIGAFVCPQTITELFYITFIFFLRRDSLTYILKDSSFIVFYYITFLLVQLRVCKDYVVSDTTLLFITKYMIT